MKNRSSLLILIVVVILLALAVNTVSAATGTGRLRISNGANISVTSSERPQIVLELGARGGSLHNAGVLCQATGTVTLTGAAFPNAFGSFSIAPNVGPFVPLANKAISFPVATAFINRSGFINIPNGQNYNVAFNVNPGTSGGQVLCILVNGATVNVLDPLSTPSAIYAAAATTITVR